VIHNDSAVEFGPGTWSLYDEDENGNRSPASGLDVNGHAGGVSASGSFTAKFPELPCEDGCEFTQVFRGMIGNGLDAAAARTFCTADELWAGVHDVPSGDPLCSDVSNHVYAIIHRPTPPGYDIVGWLEFVVRATCSRSPACATGGRSNSDTTPRAAGS